MKYEIMTLTKKIVVGKSIITTNKNGKSMRDIGVMWQKFIGEGIYLDVSRKPPPLTRREMNRNGF
ncbi:hypothetical protein SH1V18_44960 [Vallitalea longa]|uniref:Uncharacterized protein n=1 Tax=Vallitalea longa TaxID=2936439 RepID=A0A9W5YG32_9FIRM|nr:hypothetical protein [Vallitalea longa]GKX32016.1 hypothetical protein SH1V18_44960 [Vallitalea longa]